MRRGLVAGLWALFSAGVAFAHEGNPWAAFSAPTEGPARSVGEYSAGCLQGAKALPIDGLGYQVMHPSRNRVYGHPALLDFVRALGRGVRKQDLGVVLIGDLGQPRGGRAPGGHASHQSGLDVDIWYSYPRRALKGPMSTSEREQIKARSVIDGKHDTIRAELRDHVTKLLKIAVEYPSVDRVFVHPIIKRDLCAEPSIDRAIWHKLRPWYGHADHFHARLACPADSPHCQSQPPIEAGDGCGELGFWFDAKAQAERKRAQEQYQQKVVSGRGWPVECDPLLDGKRKPDPGQ